MSSFGENFDNSKRGDTAFIPKGTVINGDIEISGKLDMFGAVNGNITSDNHVNIVGNVTGNIKAEKIDTKDSVIIGNMNCAEDVAVYENTVMFGNIDAKNLLINGAVQGNIDIKGDIDVGNTAVIDSDIRAKTIKVSNGAAINGHCSLCYADININEFFPDIPEPVLEESESASESASDKPKAKKKTNK